MKFAFVKPDGSIDRTEDFNTPPLPVHPNKGQWLPDVPLSYDPVTQVLTRVLPVPTGVTAIQYTITPKDATTIATEAARLQEAVDKAAIKELPIVKQFRRLSKADVVNTVQAAFPAGPQRDLIKVLALAVWRSTLDHDPTDN